MSERSRQAPASSGSSRAGRRLANRPRALRMPSRPFSGRRAGSMLSHLGPPTAPRYTASAFWQASTVAAGRGSPVASMAAPPMRAGTKSNSWPNFLATASRTATPWATISGPMPSPGNRQIVFFILVSSCSAAALRLCQKLSLLPRKAMGSTFSAAPAFVRLPRHGLPTPGDGYSGHDHRPALHRHRPEQKFSGGEGEFEGERAPFSKGAPLPLRRYLSA